MKVSVVHTGARDRYEVAAAFSEADSLDRLITSAYFKPSVAWSRILKPHQIAMRNREDIEESAVDACFSVDLAKRVGRRVGNELFLSRAAEQMFARYAARRSRNSHVVVSYNYVAHQVFPLVAAKRVLFQCHPNPAALSNRVFEHVDLAGTGFALEREIAWGTAYRQALHNEWQLADRVIAPSSFVHNSLVSAGAAPDKVIVIPYGSDAPKAPSRRSPGSGRRNLLFVGQLVWRKGADLLPALARKLATGYQLAIVTRGLCDSRILSDLQSLPNVTVHRGIPADQLHGLYETSDALVFPSRFEGYGLVINEAMSRGLPVVGTRNTALADILFAGYEAGTLMEEIEVDALADATDRLFHADRYMRASEHAIAFSASNSWSLFRQRVRETVRRVYENPH